VPFEVRRLAPFIDICTRFGTPGATPVPEACMFPEKVVVKLNELCVTKVEAGAVVATDRSMAKVAETVMV